MPRRLLGDARYLHEKLSALKNVRAPTAMLEIVVQEKRVNMPQPQSPQPATPGLQSSPQLSSTTTSRFAHMFSRAAPVRTATTPVLAPAPAPDLDASKIVASPTPDVEKELPILSPPPSSQAAAVPEPIKIHGMANGHVSPPTPPPAEPAGAQTEESAALEAEPEPDLEPEEEVQAEAEAEADAEPEPATEALSAEFVSLDAVADLPTSVEDAPRTPPKDAPETEEGLVNGVNGDVPEASVDDAVEAINGADEDGEDGQEETEVSAGDDHAGCS